MSTRSQIGIYAEDVYGDKDILEKWEVLLYRHSDGYPGIISEKEDVSESGVIPDILPFVREFMKKRGFDTEHLGACLIAYLKFWHCGGKIVNKKDKYYSADRFIKVNGYETDPLCHGISKGFHGDIEYFYAITPTGIRVYKVSDDAKGDMTFEPIESHNIKD